jgi:hypothetical protein
MYGHPALTPLKCAVIGIFPALYGLNYPDVYWLKDTPRMWLCGLVLDQ